MDPSLSENPGASGKAELSLGRGQYFTEPDALYVKWSVSVPQYFDHPAGRENLISHFFERNSMFGLIYGRMYAAIWLLRRRSAPSAIVIPSRRLSNERIEASKPAEIPTVMPSVTMKSDEMRVSVL